MNAFVLIHFGNKPKYLELEIYSLINLRKNTKYDLVYMYSINDTPQSFLDIIKHYCTYLIPYDDNNITYNIHNYKSVYSHFNVLRTCNFVFAYKLLQYTKVCVMDSDIMIFNNIDDIFNLKTPSILFYNDKKILENYKVINNMENILELCDKESKVNGGIMIFKTSMAMYNKTLKNIKLIIKKNCIYADEILFLISSKIVYNLPFKYNGCMYMINKIELKHKINMRTYLYIIHMNSTIYKQIDIIRDNYLTKLKKKNNILYNFIVHYKKIYYDKYNITISNLIKQGSK